MMEAFNDFVNYSHYIANKNSQTIMNFLRSKDDSLILLISSLIYSFIRSEAVDPGILNYSRLFPIGKKRPEFQMESVMDSESEERKVINGFSDLNIDENSNSTEDTSRDAKAYEMTVVNSYDEPKYDHDIVALLLILI